MPHLLRLFTDPQVRTFLGGPLSIAEAEAKAKDALQMSECSRCWAARVGSSSVASFVGLISLDLHHDGTSTEVSFALLPEHLGHGYARTAVGQVLGNAFHVLGLSRVVAETQSANLRSIHLLSSLGMKFESSVVRFGAKQSIYVASKEFVLEGTY